MANDTLGLIIGILAVLKSRNCFVPINPIFPNDRIRFIINDCNIDILLVDKANYEKAQQIMRETPSVKHLICVDDVAGTRAQAMKEKAQVSTVKPVYVIYTSGSTGRPKGVPITHGNLTPLFYYSFEYLRLGIHTRVMQNLSYTFDFGIFEILTTLLFGGRLYVLNKSAIWDFVFYANFIDRQGINTLHTTPVFLSNLADTGKKMTSIKLIHLGGERLTGQVVKKTLNAIIPGCRLCNGYGPTEASINCTFFSFTWEEMAANARKNIPIGHPSDWHEIYILDRFHNLQPIGAAGELCIAGPGVSQGYLNRPELTKQKFLEVQKPFFKKVSGPRRERIYRTGDLARWLGNGPPAEGATKGIIEFLGRIDQQVKVRGFRIELGEIESCLSLYLAIKETVVLAHEHENNGNYLCAYFVAQSPEHPTVSQLREFLAKRLPDYMIPAYFIQLNKIPLTANGKIDSKALPKPSETFIDTGIEYIAPVTDLEKKLAFIWQDLLAVKRIGVMDNFFELGGDSILVNRCIARIREEMQVEIPLRKFFERPFINALSEEIEKQERQASSIKSVERVEEIPLSFAQERLWFLQELDTENVAYFVPRVIRMKGELNVHLIERTFTEIIRRHEILRTVFPNIDGRPVQRILPPFQFKIPVLDWSRMGEEEQEKQISYFLSEEGQRPFDFEKGPLLRVTLLKLPGDEYLFVLTEHHLIHDGWTQGVLLREFIAIFTVYSKDHEHSLPELPIQYADYAIWQRDSLKGEVLGRHLNYWKEKLSGLPPVLDLPFDRPRPPVISGQGALVEFHLPGSFTQALKEFSRKNGATLFMTMLAVFKTLLYRYTGVGDLCVGTGIANRRYKEMEGMLGMVINTLPLRTQVQGEISFKQYLNLVKETCLEAYQHEDTPFGKIVEVMQPKRSLSYNPLFQVMFTFMDIPGGELRLPGLELELLPAHNRSAKFDINVVVVPPPEHAEQEFGESREILVEWEYNTDIFDAPSIARMVSHYKRLLEGVLAQPETNIATLPLLSDAEIKRILFEFNDTERTYPQEKTLHQLFVEQAERTPDHVAVFGPALSILPVLPARSVRLTYRQLNEQSNRLVYFLIEKGVLVGNVVGIMMERSIDLIIGILGILKAGAAYLPIDPGSPEERIDYILADSGAKLLVNKKFFRGSRGATFQKSPPGNNKFAYIIYTSGSTGVPKGVPITHANLCPLLYWGYDYMGWGPGDHVIQTLAYYFDWSAWEIFLALTSGASLYMISEEFLLNPGAQLDFIRRNDITVMEATPTRFQSLIASGLKPGALDTLRCLCIGAEKLTVDLVKQAKELIANDCRVFNLYGPTEATIISAALEIDMGVLEKYEHLSSIPIGRMVGNGPLLVLDRYLNVCPVNVVGELYITGDGVACGYLNNPELTAERFNRSNRTYKIYIFYKTGDLARWLSDGNIEFLGRIDQQVKIRGFRIELGEIENRLLKHDHVKEAVVIDRKIGEEKYLCAYIVPNSNQAPEAAELKTYLSGSLPDYMIPSFFIVIDKIPLNPNGKIDRNVLPEPGVGETANEYTAPRDEVEKMMTEIWTEVLNPRSPIGIDDNFFDLGGHSLNAALLIARMHKTFQTKIPLKEFLQGGCIRENAHYIKEAVKEEFTFIEPVEEKEYYPLSAAQKRMYILQQMDEGSTVYNIPAVMILEGALDKNHLEGVFRQLIRRHESLRTSFITINEEPVQRIHENVEFEIEYKNSSTDYTDYTDEKDNNIHHFIQPFDLFRASLLRVALVKEEDEKHFLMVDMHHIITDGASMELFVKEFMILYTGRELVPLKLQYKDYSGWRRIMRERGALKAQEEYWLNRFSETPPVLDLPLDFPRPAIQSFEGRCYSFEISPGETAALKALASAEGTTLYMALLALYYIFLTRITGQEDIVVGTPVAGRSHADLESIMGIFINTLALRNNPSWEKDFSSYLKEVNENTLEAFAHQDYPYEELVEKASINRDTGRNPLFDTMLNLRNMDISEIEIPGLKMASFPFEENISKFDLTLRVFDAPENLRFTFEYCTRLFKMETIERFIVYFKNIIRCVVENKYTRIFELEIMPEEEKNLLLYDFNNTYTEYPYDKTIHQLFAEQAERIPDHVAVFGPALSVPPVYPVRPVRLTYRQLNEQSNRLTGLLTEKGVLGGDIVGIMMERSIDLVIGILGILESGAAYLPIEPEYPLERIDYILKDSGVKTIVGNRHACSEELNCQLSIVNCELLMSGPTASFHHSSLLAYIMYTSGSTGKPKGVVITHRNVVRLVKNTNFVPLTGETRVLQTGASVFDVSTFEIWGSLLNGGQLMLVDKEVILDAHRLGAAVKSHYINTLWLSAPLFNQLMQQNIELFASLSYLLVGGDVLSPEHINRVWFKFLGLKIINGYGPTENATFSTTYLIEKEFVYNIPIGRPIANSTAYIYDKSNRLVPIGVVGELVVGGDGVALGYLNNPELTAEKFDQDEKNKSFCGGGRGAVFSKKAPLLYKTGDLARWLPDGNIEFLGRIDHQVKIRGFRIELGEIEGQLLKHNQVKEAIVIDRQDKGEKYLCAYIVPSSNPVPSTAALRAYLTGSLPDYMIPSFFVFVERIPLNSSGKIDRKALPEPGTADLSKEYIAPRDAVEKELEEMWQEVLKTPSPISIDDNFFGLGGHSLKATLLTARIHKIFNVKTPLKIFFQKGCIREMANYIKEAVKEEFTFIEPAEKKQYYELSSAQMRLYILHQLDQNSTAYNIPYAFQLEGCLESERLEETFRKLIERHESLRTSFDSIGEMSVQRIHENVEFEIEFLAAKDAKNHQEVHHFIRAFGLSKAPLLRVGLVREEEKKHLLMVDMHHIIADGTSMGVLVKDFMALYKGEDLNELRVQYKDFTEWQNRDKERGQLSAQEEFWKKEFADEIPALDLPTDYARPAVQSYEGDRLKFELAGGTGAALKTLAIKTETTLYMLLLAIYNIFLAKLSNREEIVTGTPVAGRKHADLEKIIGMFVNTLTLKNNPVGGKSFIEFLEEVREKTIKAFENQEYPYEDLVKQVVLRRDFSRNPLFDVMFALENREPLTLELPGLKMTHLQPEIKIAKFDLTLTAVVVIGEDTLYFDLEFCTRLFKKETSERFCGYFKQLVSSILKNPEQEIFKLDILPEEEKRVLLYDFNNTDLYYAFDGRVTVDRVFENSVEKFPDHILVVAAGSNGFAWLTGVQVTYKELNARAEVLADHLVSLGVELEDIVATMLGNSMAYLTAIIGIWKAGGSFLPIASEYPQERIDYMLKDSGTKVLVNEKFFGGPGPHSAGRLLRDFSKKSPGNSNLAYIIYTSGSTGKPKGVMVQHSSFVNRMYWVQEKYGFNTGDVYLQQAAVIFDASLSELFNGILGGARIVIPAQGVGKDMNQLITIMELHKISVCEFLPSYLHVFLEHVAGQGSWVLQRIPGLRLVVVGAEVLSPGLVKLFGELFQRERYPRVKLVNSYGPTEATVDVISYECTGEDGQLERIPIGVPMGGTRIFIVDRYHGLQPLGVVGELCIAGKSLGRGYLNNPELTKQKFWEVSEPFFKKVLTRRRQRLYRTGDLARWLPNGNIEFLGRIDHQVKIRGFRIELGEIESRLLKCHDIQETVVIDRENSEGKKHLCAYFVSGKKINSSELRDILAGYLPGYMIPSYFIRVEKIPLTPNGKIDRKALESYDIDTKTKKEYAAPRNEIEQIIARIWAEVLKLEKVDIDENFFDLGGDSLDIIRINTKIKKAFNEEDTVIQMLRYPTVRSFAEYLNRGKNERVTNNVVFRSVPVDKIRKTRRQQKNKRI